MVVCKSLTFLNTVLARKDILLDDLVEYLINYLIRQSHFKNFIIKIRVTNLQKVCQLHCLSRFKKAVIPK